MSFWIQLAIDLPCTCLFVWFYFLYRRKERARAVTERIFGRPETMDEEFLRKHRESLLGPKGSITPTRGKVILK